MKLALSIAALMLSVSLSLAAAATARAETITLVDGSRIDGEVVRAGSRGFDVKTAHGQVHLEKAKIRSITFDAPPAPARAIYVTPQATLETWRKAALAGDDAGMIEAYSLTCQGQVKHELETMGFKDREQMLADLTGTKFTIAAVVFEKDNAEATLTVAQEKDGETRSGDVRFVLENGEWKMTP